MHINPDELGGKERYKLLIGSVIPRPIAFVSSRDAKGNLNLAPFSFYTIACFNPMIIVFFPVRYKKGKQKKDTFMNITETEEFVVNVASESVLEQMNATSGLYEHGVNEFEVSGLTPVQSEVVSVPGVAECPVRMECRLHNTFPVGEDEGGSDAIFGRVVHFFAEDHLIENYRIDEQRIRPVARLAGMKYSLMGEVKEIDRPKV